MTAATHSVGDKITVTMPVSSRGIPAPFGGKIVVATVEKINKKSYVLGYCKDGAYQMCYIDKQDGSVR